MLAAGKKTVEDAKTPSLPKGAGSLQRGHWTMCDGSPPNRDQPAPGPSGPPSVQAPPRLTLSSILRPPEQGLASTVLLKALPIPLYHMVPPGAPQPRAAPAPSSLDGASVPLILSPLLQPEGPPGPAQVGKPPAPMLTVSLVGAVPLLSPGLGTPLSSPGRARSSGRYLCPHCARDCLKPSVLEKHIRSHTGERPFPCATCGIAFKTQSNLYKHRRTQTHRSNAGRCSQSDGGLPDDGDSAGETPGADGRSGAGASEGPLGPLDTEVVSFVDGAPPRTLPEKSPTASKPCPLRRQQAASWDSKSPEARLRKCESSDSGYLSRSDSAEQTPASPLHGPSEGEGGLGPGGRNAPLELEKRRLEERISRLISLNQAVVDDTQLDTVRPRKTVLSKQGSIDLPLPYTYKDSFHFDMRPPEQARRRQAPLGPAHSTCAPPDKARPLSFHSVPTQLSTVECLSVTRSNSLPFVETTRTWRECGPALPAARGPRPLSPKPGLARLGPFLLAAPSSHPRALVRQGAVEDLPATPSGENSGPPADPQRTTAGQGPAGRGRTFGKRGSRRLKMFSQDKWQMYGDETFKRIYQKSRAGPQEGSKATEVSTEPLLQMETTQRGDTRTPMCEDMSTPTCGDTRTPLCGDTSTPVCEDTSTSKCGDTRTPVCGDMSTPTCGDMRTPLCGDTSTPVCEDTSTSKCGDTRTPVCGDMSTPTCGDTRTCICGVTSTPMCGDMRTSVCGDMSTPVCGDISTSVCDNVKTSLCKYTLPPTAVSSGAEPGSKGGCMSPKPSVMAEPPKTRSGGSGEPKSSIAVTPLTLICEDTPSLGWESPQLPPSVGQAPGAEVSLGLSAPKGRDHGGPKQDTVSDSDRGEIEACLWAQGTLRLPSDGLEHSLAMTDRLPLDRKKLRVEGLRDPPHGWLDSLGVGGERAEPPEVPVQPLSQLAWDIAPAGKPGALSLGADLVREGQNTSLGSTGSSLAPLDILRQREARGKESPMTPAAVPHGPYPQAPDNVFTPKYLLRLPQGENPSKLPAKRGHGQDQNAFCRREWPAESSSVVSGVGIALGPGPALVRIQGDTDGIPRDPDSPRTQDGVQRMQVGKEGEDRPDLSLLGTQDPAPIPPTLAPGSCLSQDMGFKVPATQRLCSSNMSMRTRPSGGAPHPWPPTWEKSPGDLHPRSWVQLRSHHSFLSAIARPLAWTEPAVPPPSGKPRTCEADSPFPTLGAEPQLTWCCLSPSLSLPAEQKKTTSVYSSLHPLGGDPEDQGLEGWIVTSQRHSGPGQLSKLSSVVPGTVSRAPVPKRRRPRRSTRTSRGSGRQKKLRINPKRYRGAFLQSRVQRRISRQHKPHWILSRTCHPHPHERQDPCKTLQWASPDAAGLNPQAEPSGTSSDPSLCFWDKEEKVEDDRGISATLAPRTSPRNVQEMQMAVKDISPPAGEGSNCSPQSPAAEARSTLQSHSCPVVGKDCVPPCGEDLNVGLLETQPLLPSEEVSVDTKLGIFADSQELSSFESKGAFPCHDVATSVAVICTSPGSRVSHTTLGVPSAEPPSHSWDVEETEARSLSDRKAIVEDSSLPPSPGEPLSGPFPLESTEKTLSEIPASGSSLDNSGQAEGRQEAVFPSRSQYECGEEVTPCHPLESGNKKGQVVESITLRDCVGPASPGKPAGILGDSSKTIKKRGLGGMRKQTRVDFSDTSSDDEDRLVIEI